MGTIVQFPVPPALRQEEAAEKAEAILARIGEIYRRQAQAKEELPAVLARLAGAGETELVLRAIRLWGSGEMEADEVLNLCQQSARKRSQGQGPRF
ncbi:MAG: hypothetical protein ACOY93_15560 [Bacillota bacterium]